MKGTLMPAASGSRFDGHHPLPLPVDEKVVFRDDALEHRRVMRAHRPRRCPCDGGHHRCFALDRDGRERGVKHRARRKLARFDCLNDFSGVSTVSTF